MKKNFVEIDHTADLCIKVYGKDLPELFCHALKGMYAVAGVQTESANATLQKIKLEGIDKETLLVGFLSECLFRLQQGEVYDNPQITIRNLKLSGLLRQNSLETLTREIKAVTYHQMKIVEKDERYFTYIVFDI